MRSVYVEVLIFWSMRTTDCSHNEIFGDDPCSSKAVKDHVTQSGCCALFLGIHSHPALVLLQVLIQPHSHPARRVGLPEMSFVCSYISWVAQTQEKRHDCVTLDLDRYNSPVFKLLSTSSLPLVAGIVFCKPRGSGSEWPLPLGQSLCEPVPSLGWRVSVELVVSLQDVCTEGMEGLYSRNMGSNWHNVVKDPREKFWEG